MKKKQNNNKKLIDIKSLYQAVFTQGHGATVLEDMKKSLLHGKTLYHTNQSNNDLHFHLGRQSVINDILKLIENEL